MTTKDHDPAPRYRLPRPGNQPPYLHADYGSTQLRAPTQAPISIRQVEGALPECEGPTFTGLEVPAQAYDLTLASGGEPQGERIFVGGRVLDDNGQPVPNALVEVWQCNAAGRYRHPGDQHDAPLDPHFHGAGRVLTDALGRYRFKTIRPGAYPWRNHHNAWRPAHIHFSLFGASLATRLVTQMYFPGDPLLAYDPIYHSIPDPAARERLVSTLDWEQSEAEYALGYRFDIVLRGRVQTPWERTR